MREQERPEVPAGSGHSSKRILKLSPACGNVNAKPLWRGFSPGQRSNAPRSHRSPRSSTPPPRRGVGTGGLCPGRARRWIGNWGASQRSRRARLGPRAGHDAPGGLPGRSGVVRGGQHRQWHVARRRHPEGPAVCSVDGASVARSRARHPPHLRPPRGCRPPHRDPAGRFPPGPPGKRTGNRRAPLPCVGGSQRAGSAVAPVGGGHGPRRGGCRAGRRAAGRDRRRTFPRGGRRRSRGPHRATGCPRLRIGPFTAP